MVKIVFEDISTLKNAVDVLKDMTDAANIFCYPEGLTIQALNNSRTVLGSFSMGVNGLKLYECASMAKIGVNLLTFYKMLKLVSPGYTLTFESETDSNEVKLTFESPKSIGNQIICKIRRINIKGDAYGVDLENHTVTLTMGTLDFMKICKDTGQFGDVLEFEVDKSKIAASVINVSETVTNIFTPTEINKIQIECNEPIKFSTFMKQFSLAFKPASNTDIISIRTGPVMPIHIQFSNIGPHSMFILFIASRELLELSKDSGIA